MDNTNVCDRCGARANDARQIRELAARSRRSTRVVLVVVISALTLPTVLLMTAVAFQAARRLAGGFRTNGGRPRTDSSTLFTVVPTRQ
ncbi:hypothetical protein [Streptomyces sp. NPDC002644]